MSTEPEPTQFEIKSSLEAILASGKVELIPSALLEACFNLEDHTWVMGKCSELVKHEDFWVAHTAILCVGHLARLHRTLNQALTIGIFEQALNRQDLLGSLETCLEDIEVYIRDQAFVSRLKDFLRK